MLQNNNTLLSNCTIINRNMPRYLIVLCSLLKIKLNNKRLLNWKKYMCRTHVNSTECIITKWWSLTIICLTTTDYLTITDITMSTFYLKTNYFITITNSLIMLDYLLITLSLLTHCIESLNYFTMKELLLETCYFITQN